MAQIFYCNLDRWKPMPNNREYRSEVTLFEGTISNDWYSRCSDDDRNMLGFTHKPRPEHYQSIQICPGESILPSNLSRLILNSELSETLDRAKVSPTNVHITFTDQRLRTEILEARESRLLLTRELDWVTDHVSA